MATCETKLGNVLGKQCAGKEGFPKNIRDSREGGVGQWGNLSLHDD